MQTPNFPSSTDARTATLLQRAEQRAAIATAKGATC